MGVWTLYTLLTCPVLVYRYPMGRILLWFNSSICTYRAINLISERPSWSPQTDNTLQIVKSNILGTIKSQSVINIAKDQTVEQFRSLNKPTQHGSVSCCYHVVCLASIHWPRQLKGYSEWRWPHCDRMVTLCSKLCTHTSIGQHMGSFREMLVAPEVCPGRCSLGTH